MCYLLKCKVSNRKLHRLPDAMPPRSRHKFEDYLMSLSILSISFFTCSKLKKFLYHFLESAWKTVNISPRNSIMLCYCSKLSGFYCFKFPHNSMLFSKLYPILWYCSWQMQEVKCLSLPEMIIRIKFELFLRSFPQSLKVV